MKIQRKRYAVMRNNQTEIWCGLSQNYFFKDVNSIGDTPIKTYLSEKKARSGCSSWDRDFEVVPVMETIGSFAEYEPCLKKFGMEVKDLKESIKNMNDSTEVFIANSYNPCGNISELCEVKQDTYGFFGTNVPCIILGSAQNTIFDEQEE